MQASYVVMLNTYIGVEIFYRSISEMYIEIPIELKLEMEMEHSVLLAMNYLLFRSTVIIRQHTVESKSAN